VKINLSSLASGQFGYFSIDSGFSRFRSGAIEMRYSLRDSISGGQLQQLEKKLHMVGKVGCLCRYMYLLQRKYTGFSRNRVPFHGLRESELIRAMMPRQ
jgi:hypothetical protein